MQVKNWEFVFWYVAFRNFVNGSWESRTVFLLQTENKIFLRNSWPVTGWNVTETRLQSFSVSSPAGERVFAPRCSRWRVVVRCCKHPRLEAVPVPAFSQMFAAPGCARTTAEGKAAINTHGVSSNELTRWLINSVGMISSYLVWSGGTKLLHMFPLCCFVVWAAELRFTGPERQVMDNDMYEIRKADWLCELSVLAAPVP